VISPAAISRPAYFAWKAADPVTGAAAWLAGALDEALFSSLPFGNGLFSVSELMYNFLPEFVECSFFNDKKNLTHKREDFVKMNSTSRPGYTTTPTIYH